MKPFSKQLFKLFVIIIIVKIVEAVQRLVISYKFGISDAADIYWALITIPDYIIVMTGFSTLNGVVNSQYSSLYAKKDFASINDSFSNLLSFLFLIGTIILGIVLMFNQEIASIILPGFTSTKFMIATTFSAVLLPIFFFKSFSVFFSTVLNSYKIFTFPAIIQLLLPILVLVSAFLPYYNNQLIYNLSYSNLIGSILTAFILFFYLFKPLSKINFTFMKFDTTTRNILKGCGVTFLPVIFQQLFILSKNFFASYLGEGAISSLYYAGFISGIISIIIFMSSFNLILNHLSNSFEVDKKSDTKKFFNLTLLTLISVVIPVIVLFISFNEEIVRIIYLRGNFSTNDVQKTLVPFFWESLSLLNYLVYIIFTTLYLANKRYKVISYVGIPLFLAGIFTNFLFSKIYGYYGISISNYIITLIYALLFMLLSRKYMGKINVLVISILKLLLIGLFVFCTTYVIKDVLHFRFSFGGLLISDIANTLIFSLFIFGLFNVIAFLFKVNYLKNIKLLLNT